MGKHKRHGKKNSQQNPTTTNRRLNGDKVVADELLVKTEETNSESSLLVDQPKTSDDRTAQVLEEVKRRKAIVDAAVKQKPVPRPHNRITFYPFAYALRQDYFNDYCWYCLKEDPIIQCTKKCGFAMFCDHECELLAAKDHRPECVGFKSLKNGAEQPDIEVRLLGRIVYRYKQIQNGEDKKIPEFYTDRTSKRTVMDIWSHEQQFANDKHYANQFEEIYAKLTNFYSASDLPSREDVFKLHCRDFVNRHAISDRQYQNEIGKGLYLDLCAYDHSCAPDTVFYSRGFKNILVGLKPDGDISDHQKSFYSYVDLMSSLAQRQKQLKDTWWFVCECTRCTDPNDHVLTAIKCQYCAKNVSNINLWLRDTFQNAHDVPLIIQGKKAHKIDGRVCCPSCRKHQESFHIMEANYLMRDVDLFLDQMDSYPSVEIEKKLTNFFDRSKTLLPNFNIYRARIVFNYVNWVQLTAEEKTKLFVSVEGCLRHCFPAYHPGLAFYLRDVAHFCAEAHYYADAVAYTTESIDIMERIFVEHETIPLMRSKLTDLQRRNALQKESGRLKQLPSPIVLNKMLVLGTPPLSPSSEQKSSNGSSKERTKHRRVHRESTPLPPPLLNEDVQFVVEDNRDTEETIDFDAVD
ncbi:MYND-type domain-containing protein [Aphelenchoides besseyi]|nr:MYND-type domain-containing protein [Aphelenchoides besseyi]